MYVLNQDRDEILEVNPRFTTITKAISPDTGNLLGFNLMYDGHLIGTFDSMVEAWRERKALRNCRDECYIVEGYSEWHGGMSLLKAIQLASEEVAVDEMAD